VKTRYSYVFVVVADPHNSCSVWGGKERENRRKFLKRELGVDAEQTGGVLVGTSELHLVVAGWRSSGQCQLEAKAERTSSDGAGRAVDCDAAEAEGQAEGGLAACVTGVHVQLGLKSHHKWG